VSYRWQYQSLVEPLEPSLVVAQNLDWLVETHRPPAGPEPLVQEGLWIGVLEPTLFVEQNLDWLRLTEQPLFAKPPLVQEGLWIGILEPTLFTEQNLDWLQQTNLPPDGKVPPVQVGLWVGVLKESLFVLEDVTMDKWFRPTEQPLFDKEPINVGPVWIGILERTLFTPQNLDWIPEPNQPPDGLPPLVQEGFWIGVLEPTEFVTFMMWYRPTEQPLFDKGPTYHLPSGDAVKPVVIIDWTDFGPYRTQFDDLSRQIEVTMRATAGELHVRIVDIDTGVELSSVSTQSSTKAIHRPESGGAFSISRNMKSQYGAVEGVTTQGEIWGVNAVKV